MLIEEQREPQQGKDKIESIDESNRKDEQFDVIVIGAGLSGLSAAVNLQENGYNVLVLEAKDRVGGRTCSIQVGEQLLDAGAHWVGPGQEGILKMVKKFNLQLEPQPRVGLKISDDGEKVKSYLGDIPPASIFGLLDIQFRGISNLDKWMNQVSLTDLKPSKLMDELDGQTLKSWSRDKLFTNEANEMIDGAVRSVIGVETSDISAYYFLWYVRSNKGFSYLTQVENGAQQDQIVGGTQQVSIKLAELLKNPVQLSTPISFITQNENGVIVGSDNGGQSKTFSSKYAIIAFPPTMYRDIKFTPKLHPLKTQLCHRMRMGAYIKVFVTYSTPFWKNKGFSGEVFCYGKNVDITFIYDYSLNEHFSLGIFLCGVQAINFQQKTEEEKKELIVKNLVKYFGDESKQYTHFVEHDWGDEEIFNGAPVNVFPPGCFSQFATELRTPHGRVHFAGSETAINDMGYMSGAVEAGERSATEIIQLLKNNKE